MVHTATLAAAAASLLLAAPAHAAIYSKSSPVLQVDGKSYDRLIAQSNHTSIVEFYAPWCGHCQNLKPAYEKVATSLKGIAKVAAVNCDEETNKPFCGSMGVQGFPTLKIVKPGKKAGQPIVEDYQGPRSAKAISDAVVEKISNHVKRVQDKDVDSWLEGANSTAKAILFTEKGTVSALVKSLAIDFLGSITFGQVRNTQEKTVELFGVTKFPTLVLLPGGDKDGIVYDGEMKKDAMVTFLSEIAAPNPDPPAAKPKASKKDSKKESSKSAKASSSYSSASASHASEEAASATDIKLDSEEPIPSPDPIVNDESAPKPIAVDTPAMIQMLETWEVFQSRCLTKKSPICVLTLLPKKEPEDPLSVSARDTLLSLGTLNAKHNDRGGSHVPFYSVPFSNEANPSLRSKDDEEPEIIAINAKRRWVKRYSGAEGYGVVPVEEWVDAMKMGEGKKEALASKLEEALLDEPKEELNRPMTDGSGDNEEPIMINLEDLMNMGPDSPLKVEMVEEIHDEL